MNTAKTKISWVWIERIIWLFVLVTTVATTLIFQKFKYQHIDEKLQEHDVMLKTYNLPVLNEKLTNVEDGLKALNDKTDKFIDNFNKFTTDFWKTMVRP